MPVVFYHSVIQGLCFYLLIIKQCAILKVEILQWSNRNFCPCKLRDSLLLHVKCSSGVTYCSEDMGHFITLILLSEINISQRSRACVQGQCFCANLITLGLFSHGWDAFHNLKGPVFPFENESLHKNSRSATTSLNDFQRLVPEKGYNLCKTDFRET